MVIAVVVGFEKSKYSFIAVLAIDLYIYIYIFFFLKKTLFEKNEIETMERRRDHEDLSESPINGTANARRNTWSDKSG